MSLTLNRSFRCLKWGRDETETAEWAETGFRAEVGMET